MFDDSGRTSASCGSRSHDLTARRVVIREDLARPRERGVARRRVERLPGLGDVDVEQAVALVLELKPAELRETAAEDDVDPLVVGERRLAANLVRAKDIAQRRPGLVVGKAESLVPRASLGDAGGKIVRE